MLFLVFFIVYSGILLYISQDPLKWLAWDIKHIMAYEAVNVTLTNIHRLTILCYLKHMHQEHLPVNINIPLNTCGTRYSTIYFPQYLIPPLFWWQL